MKKITFLLFFCIIYSSSIYAQCLTATYGQLPSGNAYIPNICDSSFENTIIFDGWAGEYSLVEVNIGQTYEFRSSISTDFITISDATGSTTYASGDTPVIWTSSNAEDIRFYTHTDAACGENTSQRKRSVICGSGLLSNKDVTFQDFQYYPNPVNGTLYLSSKESIDQVLIYNMIGQEVFKAVPKAISDEINVSNLSKGAYFMNISINGTSENFKIIKN
jgi:hypothetical protein